MALTKEGALKIAAAKIGISVEEYLAHQKADEKWCYKCSSWLCLTRFGHDRTRSDGRKAMCIDCCNEALRRRRASKPHKERIKKVPVPKVKREKKKVIRVVLSQQERYWRNSAAHLGIPLQEYMAMIQSGYRRCSTCKTWKFSSRFDMVRQSDTQPLRCLDCDEQAARTRVSAFIGKTHSPQSRQKMSKARRNNHNRLGKPFTPEQRAYLRLRANRDALRGEKNHNWKGGITPENALLRHSAEYMHWSNAVLARDGYTCQMCGDNKGGNLNAHHLYPWSEYPEKRFDVSNGLTLCESCHMQVHHKPDSYRNRAKARKAALDR